MNAISTTETKHRATEGPDLFRHLARSLADVAADLASEIGEKPTSWVQVFPKGPELAAVDGRKWVLDDPDALVAAHIAMDGLPILVDYDHLSAFDPGDADTRAAGWIEELEVRDGEIWAKVAWTIRAAQEIASGEWRYLSPEFTTVQTVTGKHVARLDAVALVNRPAFQMAALAAQSPGVQSMKTLAAELNLPEDATEEQILAAIQSQKTELAAAKSATPSAQDYMPRKDYDTVLARAEKAEGELASQRKEARDTEVAALIDEAVKAGKIAPASKAHFVALASQSDQGFEEVKALCGTLGTLTHDPKDDDPNAETGGTLSQEDRDLCARMGIDPEEYAKTLAMKKRSA